MTAGRVTAEELRATWWGANKALKGLLARYEDGCAGLGIPEAVVVAQTQEALAALEEMGRLVDKAGKDGVRNVFDRAAEHEAIAKQAMQEAGDA